LGKRKKKERKEKKSKMVDHLTHEHPLPLEQDIDNLAHLIADFSLSRIVTAAHCLYVANFFFSSPTLKIAAADITWFTSFVLCFLQVSS